jgi:glucokinase
MTSSHDSHDSLAIGIDMGGTSVKLGVCRGAELLFHADPIETQHFKGADELLAVMAKAVLALKTACPGVKAVGVGVPGFTDVNTGMVYHLTNVNGWNNVLLNDIMQRATGLPTFAENDANCMTYAEFKHGAGMGSTNMIGVTLGTGVGGGLVLDGRLFRGSACGAGEIGQMSIDYAGKPGAYGNTGGLEEYVGNRETAARAAALYAKAGIHKTAHDCEPKQLAAAAVAQDPVALQVWDEFTTQLASSLANCCWLLNPDTIVIGGGIARAGDLLFDPLKRKIVGQMHQTFTRDLKILPAKFGNEAGIIGSAAVAQERVS